MVLKKRRVVAALRKKGFEKDKDGKHIVLAYRFLDGTPSKIKTHVSHGSKRSDLSDHLIAEMSRQIKLPKKEFVDLVSCSMSQADYEKIVQDQHV